LFFGGYGMHHIKKTSFILDVMSKGIYFVKFAFELHPTTSLFDMPFKLGRPQQEWDLGESINTTSTSPINQGLVGSK